LQELAEGLARHGDRAAFVGVCSYGELGERIGDCARALTAAGVRPGDRVAYLGRSSVTCFEVVLGAASVGALAVPLSWRLTAEEVAGLLGDAEPAVVVAGPEDADRAGADAVVVGEPYEAWLAAHRTGGRAVPTRPVVGADDPALILYTSGTTARPKGVVLTHGNLAAMVASTLPMIGLDERSVHLVCMPLFHIAGLGAGVSGLAAGASTVLLADADPARVVDAVARHRVTHTLLVPSALRRVVEHLEAHGGDVSSLASVVYGASPIAPDVLERALRALPARFHQTYGLTESTGRVVVLGPDDHRAGGPRLRSAGRPLPGVELRFDGPEICVRSPHVMAGYWRRPDETAAVLAPDGWLRTGDAGHLDADGYLFVTDRLKDVIVSGGENVSPAEVEDVLRGHPGVADVAVVGVPDPRWGETVRAFVVRRDDADGRSVTTDDLAAFARGLLAGFKCPKGYEWIDALPRSASGKVLKRDLRAAFWANEQRAVG
jgi:long-chain acyl-CoA synthetase